MMDKNIITDNVKNDLFKSSVSNMVSWIDNDIEELEKEKIAKNILKTYQKLFASQHISKSEIIDIIRQGRMENKERYQGIIMLPNICFVSMCQHHLLPFEGKVSIAYLPKSHIVSFGRIVQLIKIVSHKMQIQEDMTSQIGNFLYEALEAQGVAVLIKAKHSCSRVIYDSSSDSYVSTSIFLGKMQKTEYKMEIFNQMK